MSGLGLNTPDTWKELIAKYAEGRTICNCGDAYYFPVGEGIDAKGCQRSDMMVCSYGCSAAQLIARDYIADRILKKENPIEPVMERR